LKNKKVNFVFSYNPHFEFSNEFLKHLEDKIKSLQPLRPSFIIGDLNHDLLTNRSENLKSLMLDYNFATLIDAPTHFVGESATAIDVVYYNNTDSILKSTIIPCPFSNHEFILATLNFDTNCSNISSSINARVLNNKSLDHIQRELDATNFDIAKQFIDIDERWAVIKRIIASVVDKIAPVKKFRLKKRDNHPWVDTELHYHIAVRDKLHEIAVRSETIGSEKNRSNSNEWISFRAQRSLTQRLF
jgi:hypothetical protein